MYLTARAVGPPAQRVGARPVVGANGFVFLAFFSLSSAPSPPARARFKRLFDGHP